MSTLKREREVCLQAIRAAGALAQQGFGGPLQVEDKAGGEGPVSNYDRACDALIREQLSAAFPGDALLTEESEDDGAWQQAERVWIVDPIDGTQEYVTGVPQYAVMIGLCVDGVPQFGAVYAPAQDLLLVGEQGHGTSVFHQGEQRALVLKDKDPREAWRIAVSRSHGSPEVERVCAALAPSQMVPMGSVGLKIASVCQGQTDLYVATTTRIKLWDSCGPHALLSAAGGVMVDLFGRPLDYRRQRNHPYGLLACAQQDLARLSALTAPIAHELYPEGA